MVSARPRLRIWDLLQLFVINLLVRTADLLVLLPRPLLLVSYIRIVAMELWRSPYRWPSSFEATLARQSSGQELRELVYGETPLSTGIWLLWRAGAHRKSHFVDLGAGRGRALLAARWLGANARGIEIVSQHVRLVRDALGRVGAEIEQGDAAHADIADATHVMIAWTAFSATTRKRFIDRIKTCKQGTRVIAIDGQIEDDDFVTLSRHWAPFTWGFVPVWIQELRGSSRSS